MKSEDTPTNPTMRNLEPIPPGADPFEFDHVRQGTRINERIIAMWYGPQSRNIVLVDQKTGAKVMVTFPEEAE